MNKIRFSYASAEVNPSVILLLFFRSLGIYVYERLIDTTQEMLQQITDFFENDQKITILRPMDDFDVEIFYVSSWEEYQLILQRHYIEHNTEKAILICSDEEILREATGVEKICALLYNEKASELNLLLDLVVIMQKQSLLSVDLANQFSMMAKVYCKNRLWALSLGTKYFYVTESSTKYKNIIDKYQTVINMLFDTLQQNRVMWGEPNCWYLQYAALNIIYEFNLYNQRSRHSDVYNSREVAELCGKIIQHLPATDGYVMSFHLLQAQVYDDLLGDINMAYESYLDACKDYNAYAYFRKGIYWQNYAADYDRALKYYDESVRIYPEYYRAWYRIGSCYMQLKQYKKALKAFNIVAVILNNRMKKNTIRPMEIEYLFKAKNQNAFICNKVLQNPAQAIVENIGAINAWEAIRSSCFYSLMCDSMEEKAMIQDVLANQLNVIKIWMELMKLGNKTHDDYLVKYCADMINK